MRSRRARRTDASYAENGAEKTEEPESAAVLAGLPPEALLLEKEEREIAAGVSPEQPFGVRGASSAGRGTLALGFTAAAGGLLAILTAYALIVIRHQLVLILIAGFVAVGLDPGRAFPAAARVLPPVGRGGGLPDGVGIVGGLLRGGRGAAEQ